MTASLHQDGTTIKRLSRAAGDCACLQRTVIAMLAGLASGVPARLLSDDLPEDRAQLVEREAVRGARLQAVGVLEHAEAAGLADDGDVLLHLHHQVACRVLERVGKAVAGDLAGGDRRGVALPETAAARDMRVTLGGRAGEGVPGMQLGYADQSLDLCPALLAHHAPPCTLSSRSSP